MSFEDDREYARAAALPDWLQSFADDELKKGGNPFDDIRELFKSKNDLDAVEARVDELRQQVGLDVIEKVATVNVENTPKQQRQADDCKLTEIQAKTKLLVNLIAFAQALEDEGLTKAASMVDEKIKSLQNDPLLAKDKDVKELPEKYQKYEGLEEFIQNACRTSGGYASAPAIQNRIRKEFDDEIDIKGEGLEEYIRYCLSKHKKFLPDDKEHAGEYISIIVTEDNDGNENVFDESSGDKQ